MNNIRADQTHCKNGHPLDGDNLIMRPDGRRNCRACKNEWGRNHYHATKPTQAAPQRNDVITSPLDLPFAKRITITDCGYETPCWCWNRSQDECEYPATTINKQHWLVHRWVFQQVYGYLPPVVMHLCDNAKCCRPDHLQAGTHQTNRADCVAKDRHAKGEHNGRAKLNEAKVLAILASDESTATLARRYEVCSKTIFSIRIGQIWKDAALRAGALAGEES